MQTKRSQERYAPPERLEPEPPHLVAEPPYARVIARDRVVVQMPLQHLLLPASGLRDGSCIHLRNSTLIAIGGAQSAADRFRYMGHRVKWINVDLLSDLDRVIDLDAQIANGGRYATRSR